jgi:hypothetical protein
MLPLLPGCAGLMPPLARIEISSDSAVIALPRLMPQARTRSGGPGDTRGRVTLLMKGKIK